MIQYFLTRMLMAVWKKNKQLLDFHVQTDNVQENK